MHISDGILAQPALVTGAVAAAAGVALGLRKLDDERIPRVAVLSSAFFVASLLPVPLGLSSIHLVLCGLMGVLLGWAAFPAVLIALLLQKLLFGVGGLTTLGVNTCTMAAPAVVCHYLFGWGVRKRGRRSIFVFGFGAGCLGVLLGAALTCLALLASGKAFLVVAEAVAVPHLAVAAVEGLITGYIAGFLRKVKPELLDLHTAPAGKEECAHA